MRYSLAIVLLLAACSHKGDLAEKLAGKHWFVQARNWETDRIATFTTDSLAPADWELILYGNGKMFYASTYPFNFTDANGVEHLKGERFADSLYNYQIKNNVLRVSKEDEIYYLRFEESDAGKYTITPATEADFK